MKIVLPPWKIWVCCNVPASWAGSFQQILGSILPAGNFNMVESVIVEEIG
jgi:hypothetical protein